MSDQDEKVPPPTHAVVPIATLAALESALTTAMSALNTVVSMTELARAQSRAFTPPTPGTIARSKEDILNPPRFGRRSPASSGDDVPPNQEG